MALDGGAGSSPSCSRRSRESPAAGCCGRPSACRDAARELGQRRRDRRQLGVDDRQPLADLQHRRGVGDVLRRRAPVAVFAELVAAQRVELRDDAEDRIADALGLLRAACPCRSCRCRSCARSRRRPPAGMMPRRPCTMASARSMSRYLRSAVLVGPDLAHRVGAEDVAEDAESMMVDPLRRYSGGLRYVQRVQLKRDQLLPVAATRWRNRRLQFIARTVQERPGLQDDGAVDHPAVELNGALVAFCRSEHAARPLELRRASARARRGRPPTCFGWMHSLAPKPQARAKRKVGQQPLVVVERGVTPATGAASPAAATRSPSGWRRRASPRSSPGRSRSTRVVERAEDEALNTPRGGDAVAHWRSTRRSRSSAAPFRLAASAASTALDLAGRFRLRQHDAYARRVARQTSRSSANHAVVSSLMRIDHLRYALVLRTVPVADGIARGAPCRSERRRPPRSSTTASAPERSALSNRSGRLPARRGRSPVALSTQLH